MSNLSVIDLFVEDRAHEALITSLIRRVGREENNKTLDLKIRSSTGGHGRVITEFKNYQILIEKGVLSRPELIVVAIDANCSRFSKKRQEIEDATQQQFQDSVIVACPDPHVERWYMADPASSHRTVGKTPHIKQKKCERDYYKKALSKVIHPL